MIVDWSPHNLNNKNIFISLNHVPQEKISAKNDSCNVVLEDDERDSSLLSVLKFTNIFWFF
jgi:hypothetical protein